MIKGIGFFHICVAVDDIQEAWKKVLETGAPQDDAPKQGADSNWRKGRFDLMEKRI